MCGCAHAPSLCGCPGFPIQVANLIPQAVEAVRAATLADVRSKAAAAVAARRPLVRKSDKASVCFRHVPIDILNHAFCRLLTADHHEV